MEDFGVAPPPVEVSGSQLVTGLSDLVTNSDSFTLDDGSNYRLQLGVQTGDTGEAYSGRLLTVNEDIGF